MMYKIFYIDEDKAAVHRLTRSLGTDFEIIEGFSDGITLETLTPILDEKDFDFLLVDSNLNEKSGCGFNGEDVIGYFTKKFPHFPVMLFTNYDDQVVSEIENFDINKIYSKRELIEEEAKNVFIMRINRIINEYKLSVEAAERKIVELVEKNKSGKTLTAIEEQELIQLDAYLDEVQDADVTRIPEQIKASNANKIDELLSKTDNLIERLQKYESI